jgi:hypothetical protein
MAVCHPLKTGKTKWLVLQVFYDFVYEFVICSSVNAMMYIMTLTSTWKQVTTSFWQDYWFLNHKNGKLILTKERFGERLSTQIITICLFKLPSTYLFTADSYMLSYALSVVVNAISKTLKRELNLFLWY